MTGGTLCALGQQDIAIARPCPNSEANVRSKALRARFQNAHTPSFSFFRGAFRSLDWILQRQLRKQNLGLQVQELGFQTVATLAVDRQAEVEGSHTKPQNARRQGVRGAQRRPKSREGLKPAPAVVVEETRFVEDQNDSAAGLVNLASLNVIISEPVLESRPDLPSQTASAPPSDQPSDGSDSSSSWLDRSPGLPSTSGSDSSTQTRSRRSSSRQRESRIGADGTDWSLGLADGFRGGRSKLNENGSLGDSTKWKARGRAAMDIQEMQPEDLRKAVEEAFPSTDPVNLFLDTPPTPPPTPVNGVVTTDPGIDPKLLLDALTQPPSKLRKIALEAVSPKPPLSSITNPDSQTPATLPLPASDQTSPGADTFQNMNPPSVSDTPADTRDPSKADAVARARAALLDPAVIANWDKVVVGDWDPLPVSLVPVRGGFADRRGVVRSAQNPPKPHPLTSLSALYKEVVALFDPQGVDSLLDRRQDEGLIKRSELMELIKRLGEAGGSVKKPLAVFRWMQRQEQECLRPLESSYSVMVRLLGKLNAAEAAVGLIREMEASGLERNVQTYNALMSGLAKRGKFEECWQLFQQMKAEGPVPEVWTYNNLITAAAQCLPGKEALKQGLLLLGEMQTEGLKPNVFTFNTLMQTGVKARDLSEVKRLFGELREWGCVPDRVSFNTIIKACLEKRDWEGLFEQFSAMQAAGCAPDTTTYDSIISAYTQQRRFAEALALLDEMREGGCRPDLRTYNSLLHACADAGEGDRGRVLLRSMLRLEMKPTVFHWCSLMNAFAKAGRCDDAASVFRDMQAAKIAPTMYAYNILLDAYCRAGRFTTAEGLLRIMQKSPCKPNIVSYNTLIGAYARAKDLDQVKLVFKAMLKGGCGPNHQTQRIVSQAFEGAKRGREATRLFWEAKQAAKRRKRAVTRVAQVSDGAGDRDSLVKR